MTNEKTSREKAVELIASMNLVIDGRLGPFSLPISDEMAEAILDQIEETGRGGRVLGTTKKETELKRNAKDRRPPNDFF